MDKQEAVKNYQDEIKLLFCKCCPANCESLTKDERLGCLASGSFYDGICQLYKGWKSPEEVKQLKKDATDLLVSQSENTVQVALSAEMECKQKIQESVNHKENEWIAGLSYTLGAFIYDPNVGIPESVSRAIKRAMQQAVQAERENFKNWLTAESKRHKDKVLGDAFERVLTHYCQHKDIATDLKALKEGKSE